MEMSNEIKLFADANLQEIKETYSLEQRKIALKFFENGLNSAEGAVRKIDDTTTEDDKYHRHEAVEYYKYMISEVKKLISEVN